MQVAATSAFTRIRVQLAWMGPINRGAITLCHPPKLTRGGGDAVDREVVMRQCSGRPHCDSRVRELCPYWVRFN